ncbi:lymphocyte antigen 96 [Hyperolius riggenbachi]|uniref:lymphocyte antigen 96 n=1 Tax=Hyperolius riggenbachi TaxID=752182 RepID=UPI0035A2F625
MFTIIIFLIGFVPVKTKHVVCDEPNLELYYSFCGESFVTTAAMKPCVFNRQEYVNLSMTFIPRTNLDYVYAIFEVWHNSFKVSDATYPMCSGVDDDFSFCGALKGETIKLFKREHFPRLPDVKGVFTSKFRVFAGLKEEQIICIDFMLNIKE